MKIETRSISSLVLDPANARTHDAKNIAAIKGSLARFGQQKPIVITPKGVVIAGNGTLSAATELGWETIAVVVTELSGSDLTAFGLADNRTAELAEWDPENLGALLKALSDEEFPLESIGFDPLYMENLFTEPKPAEGSKEIGAEEFQKFDKCCPRCGFEFDDASPT